MLISGPLCDWWARGIQDKLALKVLGNPLYHVPPTHADNDPALWEWFVREFTQQFTDSAEEENAFAALQKLELKENDADTYINRFIELAEKAQWGLDTPGTIRLFRAGLPVNMHRAICRYQHLPRDMQEWFEATREECKRYNDMAVSIGPRGGAGNISTHQNRLRGIEPPKQQQKRKDPNAMEVDVIKTSRLSDEEKAKLLKEGWCFRCKKMGHLSRNCPDKKDSKGKGCCCSLCCVRASLQSPCRALWSCVLHSTSSVIVSRVLWKLCYIRTITLCFSGFIKPLYSQESWKVESRLDRPYFCKVLMRESIIEWRKSKKS